MEQNHTQHIHCTVESCRHHSDGDGCRLSNIDVSQLSGEAKTARDSMCKSFTKRQG